MVDEIDPVHVVVTENIGRDIWAFVQALRVGQDIGYKFGCKIHSKMSTNLNDGAVWRARLLNSLLDPSIIEQLECSFFRQPTAGLAGKSHSFHTLHNRDTLEHNHKNMKVVMSRLGRMRPRFDEFVAGSMFWFRFEALRGIAEAAIDSSWFDPELGQIDGTIAHAFERIFVSYVRGLDWTVIKYS